MEHHYKATVKWTGNTGNGTASYKGYERAHTISVENKPVIEGSSNAPFHGDISKHNPEDLFLSSISSCHMLWFLHLCADHGIIVVEYEDLATGIMLHTPTIGRFTEVVLHPQVTISDHQRMDDANALHDEAHKKCFISNSCNFPILIKSECKAL